MFHFVFSSSASVYGASDSPLLDESLTPSPESPYGATKMMMEHILHDVANATALRYVAFRYFNVAGADARGRNGDIKDGGGLVKTTMLCATGARGGMEIHGTDYPTAVGTAVRDYIHVSDVAAAYTTAPERPADIRKIRSTLGFTPQYNDLDEIIATVAAWERKNKDRLAEIS